MPACSPVGDGTRTSLDRGWICSGRTWPERACPAARLCLPPTWPCSAPANPRYTDRKSTRLNSSHQKISYAVFCLKKKKGNGDIKASMKRRVLGRVGCKGKEYG